MAEAAELEPADEVLEIGPGLGILTNALLAQAGRVVAVELDRHLAERLPGLLSDKRLEVVHDDALRFDPADHFETDYKLVANLPYQITSPVLHRYLVQVRRPAALVLMVQREVAERIAAGPGKANYLAVLVQAVAEIRLVRRVPASAFYPRPRVDSAVMLLRLRSNPAVSQTSLPDLLRLVRAGYTQPRKTTVNSLAQGLDLPRGEVESALTAAGIEPRSRPQQLSISDWLTLLRSGALSQRTRDERSRLSNRESE
jgi:16S rRNA (adenine1518-N6/adenine1519-N6)-dimethyltransferase